MPETVRAVALDAVIDGVSFALAFFAIFMTVAGLLSIGWERAR